MHDVMLVLVVAAVIVTLAIIATVLAIAVAAMVVLVRCFVAGMVAAFISMALIAVIVVVVSIVAAVAVAIVTIVLIVRVGATSVTMSRPGAALARFLGARFLGGLLGFLPLELVEYSICSISVLTLLEEADECDVVVGQSFVRFHILLLMLPQHRKEDLLDLLRLGWKLHHCMKEPFFKVAHELHSTAHVVVHGH